MFRTMPLNLCKPWTRKKKEKEKDGGSGGGGGGVHPLPVRPHAALSPSKQRLRFFFPLPGCFFISFCQIVCKIIALGSAEPERRSQPGCGDDSPPSASPSPASSVGERGPPPHQLRGATLLLMYKRIEKQKRKNASLFLRLGLSVCKGKNRWLQEQTPMAA